MTITLPIIKGFDIHCEADDAAMALCDVGRSGARAAPRAIKEIFLDLLRAVRQGTAAAIISGRREVMLCERCREIVEQLEEEASS